MSHAHVTVRAHGAISGEKSLEMGEPFRSLQTQVFNELRL